MEKVSRIHLLGLATALVALVAIAGCSNEPATSIEVQGMVTVEGRPFYEGLITFVPLDGTPGSKISVPIEASRYVINQEHGLQIGEYAVEVYGMPPAVKAMVTGQPIEHQESGYREVAMEFNSQTTLRAPIHEGANEHNFDVRYR